MYEREKFAVIGGDRRSIFLCKILSSEKFYVNSYGINDDELTEDVNIKSTLDEAVKDADIIIGPLPCSLDQETVNAPFFNEKIYYRDIFRNMNKNQLFFGGLIDEKIKQCAITYNVFISDYFNREELAVLNGVPTAEGAIKIAMEETPYTLHESKCLVIGYGRIGKVLSKMLHGIGADVYVSARKHSDLAWIKSYGYQGVGYEQLESYLSKFDIVFNTVPSMVLNKDLVNQLQKECLIIDLASKPGGVDFEAAKELGIKTIWALSLPGKVAPYTAAKIIKSTIFNIIDELGV